MAPPSQTRWLGDQWTLHLTPQRPRGCNCETTHSSFSVQNPDLVKTCSLSQHKSSSAVCQCFRVVRCFVLPGCRQLCYHLSQQSLWKYLDINLTHEHLGLVLASQLTSDNIVSDSLTLHAAAPTNINHTDPCAPRKLTPSTLSTTHPPPLAASRLLCSFESRVSGETAHIFTFLHLSIDFPS